MGAVDAVDTGGARGRGKPNMSSAGCCCGGETFPLGVRLSAVPVGVAGLLLLGGLVAGGANLELMTLLLLLLLLPLLLLLLLLLFICPALNGDADSVACRTVVGVAGDTGLRKGEFRGVRGELGAAAAPPPTAREGVLRWPAGSAMMRTGPGPLRAARGACVDVPWIQVRSD